MKKIADAVLVLILFVMKDWIPTKREGLVSLIGLAMIIRGLLMV